MNLRTFCKIQAHLIVLSLFFHTQAILAAPNNSGFQPEINIQLQYEDNVRRTPEKNKQNDSILIIKPDLPLRWGFGKHKINLAYKGEYAQYFEQGVLDYNNHKLSSYLLLDHSSRLNTEYELGYVRGHDKPSNNDVIANLTAKPNQWKESYARTTLSYGKNSSQGQIITRLERKQRSYTNNNQQFLDTDKTSLSGIFYYRIAPKTRIPFELSVTNYDYQNIIPARDPSSIEYKYLVGISWDATAKSSGILQFGLLEKGYNNNLYENISIFMLRLDGTWKPNTYTKIVFGAIRDTQESAQASSQAYIQNHLDAKITHMVTSRTMLFLSMRYTIAKPANLETIKSTRFNVQIKARHNLRHWLDAGITYKHVERNSDLDNLDFKTNIFMLEVRARFNY